MSDQDCPPVIELCDNCGDSWLKDYLKTRDNHAWVFVDKDDPDHICGNHNFLTDNLVELGDGNDKFTVDASIGTGVTERQGVFNPAPNGPCAPWINCAQLRSCCDARSSDEELEFAIRVASEILYALSGRRWGGICERTIRPACLNGCNTVCTCAGVCDIDERTICLPGPIAGVKHVFINGEELPPSEYFCSGYRNLVRCGKPWPSTNDMCGDPYKAPTVSVVPVGDKFEVCGKPWADALIEGNGWFHDVPALKVDCSYCYGQEYDDLIPSWAEDVWASMRCTDDGKLDTPCEDCSDWVNGWLRKNNVKVLEGRAIRRFNEDGLEYDSLGRTYVSGRPGDVRFSDEFKRCCFRAANFCCAGGMGGSGCSEPNLCCRVDGASSGCGCGPSVVSFTGSGTQDCVDECPKEFLTVKVPAWAERYLERDGHPVASQTHSFSASRIVGLNQGDDTFKVPEWLRSFLEGSDERVTFGHPPLEINEQNEYVVCHSVPDKPEMHTKVVVEPCNYANFCCAGHGVKKTKCEWFVVEDGCKPTKPGDGRNLYPDMDKASLPVWVRAFFGLNKLESIPVEEDERFPDWVNKNLATAIESGYDFGPKDYIIESDEMSPWAVKFISDHDIDTWGNTYQAVGPVEPVYTGTTVEPLGTSKEFDEAQKLVRWKPEYTSWEITYYAGREIPYAAQMACAELACEIAKSRCGQECRLPQNTAFANMNGISVSMTPLHKLLENGSTGLWGVDMWLRAVNPGGLRFRSVGLDPQQYRNRHRIINNHPAC